MWGFLQILHSLLKTPSGCVGKKWGMERFPAAESLASFTTGDLYDVTMRRVYHSVRTAAEGAAMKMKEIKNK